MGFMIIGAVFVLFSDRTARSGPELTVYLCVAGFVFVAYVGSRVARLRRLCRIGVEVEGRLLVVGTHDTETNARYLYRYRGTSYYIKHSSWLKRLALRHGPRIIVLIDPRRPDDAVILGRLPSTIARTP